MGKLFINPISDLVRIGGGTSKSINSVNPSLLDIEGDSDLEDETSGKHDLYICTWSKIASALKHYVF